MRKIILDCGGHIGESVKRFKQSSEYDEEFEIYSFEPVAHLAKRYKDSEGIRFFPKAVWIEDTEIDFYIDRRHDTASGSTLVSTKTSGHIDFGHPSKVQAINFSKWIVETFSASDYIILKMDIEGAEYQVLPHMIATGAINYVNKAYIEFHSHKIGVPSSDHDDLIKKLRAVEGLSLLPEMHKVLK